MKTRLVLAAAAALLVLVPTAPSWGASGTFDRMWGKNVDNAGVAGFEVCTFAPQCQTATASTGLGGELSSANGVATDPAGNVYVADQGNHRVQKYDSAGNFLRAWGKDVVASGPGNTGVDFERCVVAVDTCKIGIVGSLGGELNNPRSIGVSGGSVFVTEGTNQRVTKYDTDGNFLRAWGKDVVASGPGDAGTAFEVCVVSVDTCKAGTAGGLGGELSDPSALGTDAAGNVYVGEFGGERIQRFDGQGAFNRAWGTDVASAGPGNTGTGVEICVASVDTCKTGVNDGFSPGGDLGNPTGIAVDASGKVYVADSFHHRIQRFDSLGNFELTWGTNVVQSGPGNTGTGVEICVAANGDSCSFGLPNDLGGEMFFPDGVAVDSSGLVYVTADRRIQRFGSGGNFQRAWGRNVAVAGPGDTGTGFEVCVAGADTCGDGAGGGLGGELNLPRGLATNPAGDLYVTDSSRIQKFVDPVVPAPSLTATPGPAAAPAATSTGRRAAALKKCKKKKSAQARKKCKKKAGRLPL